ncbi:hypothetical protein BSL78_22966 [Apostichopus japonicus]|uniref:Uncharacterized protein n=1 Tax=Stichopus japonicus TaxID=307972 RepID=A0A2G8JWU7_STIJA|nr:hypothetical protein BSL78_22966 [Apostichopus japonicus]
MKESKRAPSVPNSLDEFPTDRTLGVCSDAENGHITAQVPLSTKLMTKRGLLSVTSSINDPLGFATPFVLVSRSLLPDVCMRGASWDEPLSDEETKSWQDMLIHTLELSEIRVSRCLELDKALEIQLRSFCDASGKGYAAVSYVWWRVVRTKENPADERSRRLVTGKWLIGPDILSKDETYRPESRFEDVSTTEDPEINR